MNKKTFTLLGLPAVKNTRQVMDKFPFPIDLTIGRYGELKFVFHQGKIQVLHKESDTRDFSFVWLSSNWDQRDLAHAICLYLKSTKTPHSYVEESTSKITDCMVFGLNNLPMPDTLFVSRKNIAKDIPLIKKVCGFPLIIKDSKGSQGKYSAFAANETELLEKTSNLPKSKNFIFQRFIPNEYDWGIMVANGVVVSGEKSYPSNGEFRNNTCNGAKEIFIDTEDIPKKIKDIAIKASASLGLSWSRADIIIDKNTGLPYLLEVNRFPGITSNSDEVLGAYTFLNYDISRL